MSSSSEISHFFAPQNLFLVYSRSKVCRRVKRQEEFLHGNHASYTAVYTHKSQNWQPAMPKVHDKKMRNLLSREDTKNVEEIEGHQTGGVMEDGPSHSCPALDPALISPATRQF